MAVLDSYTLLDGGLHEAENVVGHSRDTKFMIGPNALGQKALNLVH